MSILYKIGKNTVLTPIAVWEGCVSSTYLCDWINGGIETEGFFPLFSHEAYIDMMVWPAAAVVGGLIAYKGMSYLTDLISGKGYEKNAEKEINQTKDNIADIRLRSVGR